MVFSFFKPKKSNITIIDGIKIIKSSNRLKTISIQIKNGKAEIHSPMSISENYLKSILKKKKSWIEKKIRLDVKKEKILVKDNYNFPFLGKKYKLKILSSLNNKVSIKKDRLFLFCKDLKQSKEILISWLKINAQKTLSERIRKISLKLKINYKSVFIKNYRARWGCCCSNSEIFLNWKLVMLPPSVIDYVIIHELCHIIEPNHSKSFWLLIERFDKDFKSKKIWLSKNGKEIIQF